MDNRGGGGVALAGSPFSAWMRGISKFENRIFTRHRLALWGYCLLAAYVIAFVIRFFAGKWMIDKAGDPTFRDFIWIWIGGRFALSRDVSDLFNYSTFSAAQASLMAHKPPPGDVPYYYWVYPPTLLMVLAPFALLPYLSAFLVWIVSTASVYMAAVYLILPSGLSVLLALLPCAALMNVSVGQAAFLTAGLIGLSLIFMQRRPYLSGAFLGLLTYKPQFGLFFPIALLVTRQWRVIAGAAASALLFAGTAALLFGPHTWVLFARSLSEHNPATLMPGYKLQAVNQTVFGLMHWASAGIAAAWTAHLAIALPAAALACWIWIRPGAYSLKAAAFSLAALIATPYMLVYDLTTLSIPAAFLIEDGLARGFLPGERMVLFGCFLALFAWNFFPVGPPVMLAMMGLVIRRASLCRTANVTDTAQCATPRPCEGR